MRVLLQKTEKASVEIEGCIHASMGQGLLVLLGIEEEDDESDIPWLVSKISRLRVFDDEKGVMNLSVQDVRGELMVISQFTLHASTKKGNRPSYIRAARPEHAIPLYERFIKSLEEESGCRVCSGSFGAYMKVSLVNDGPVTISIDTKNRE